MNNRSHSFTDYSNSECNLDNKYDIVVGPVADDDMAMLFRQYQNELITFENLINGMTFRKTTNQYSFHTDMLSGNTCTGTLSNPRFCENVVETAFT